MQNFFIFLIILYMFRAPTFFSRILEINFGLPPLEYYPVYFLLLPVLYFAMQGIVKGKFALPYFITFSLTIVIFLFMESEFFRGTGQTNLVYPYYLLIIYTCFITLINYGIKPFIRDTIIKYSIIIISIMVFFQYLGYLGLINIVDNSTYVRSAFIENHRVVNEITHLNGMSFNCVIGMYLLFIYKSLNDFSSTRKRIFFWILIFLFFGLIIINATRGAFLLAALGFIVFFYDSWKNMSRNQKLIIIPISMGVTIVGSFYIFGGMLPDIYLAKRLTEETSLEEARVKQIILSLRNFVNNPWFGVGYNNATRGDYGLSRSNFSYTQILASNGLFYFILYMNLLIKLFGKRLKNINSILLSLAAYGSLMFYNLSLLGALSLIAYLTYYEKQNINNTHWAKI